MSAPQVKIEIYVPASHVGPLHEALHQVGAGRIGNYDHCLSVTQVTGYWRPLAEARPYDGRVGALSEAAQCKMELRCPLEAASDAVKAIRRIHPYEEPVINIIPLLAVE